jgi:hypothetical protein
MAISRLPKVMVCLHEFVYVSWGLYSILAYIMYM